MMERIKRLKFLLAAFVFGLGQISGVLPAVAQSGAVPANAGTLPAVEQILSKSIAATGGREAWLKLHAMRLSMDVSVSGTASITGSSKIVEKAPDKSYECTKLGPGYFSCEGYDGKTGWSDSSVDGLVELQGKKLEELKLQADFYSELNRASHYSDLAVARQDVFDNLPVYVLRGTRKDGTHEEMYFAKESGLEIGGKRWEATEADARVMHMGSYKEVAQVGLKIPTKVSAVSGQSKVEMILTEVEPNVSIEDSIFAKPSKAARDSSGAGNTERPDNGRVVDGVYANEFFNFSYEVPKGWVVHGEETQKAIVETGEALVAEDDESKKRLLEAAEKRTRLLLTVFEFPLGTPGKPNRGIQVVAENVAFAPGIKSGADYIAAMKTSLAGTSMNAGFAGQPTEEKLSGMTFFRQSGTLQVAGKTIYETYHVAILKGYAVLFVFTGASDESVKEASGSMWSLRSLGPASGAPK